MKAEARDTLYGERSVRSLDGKGDHNRRGIFVAGEKIGWWRLVAKFDVTGVEGSVTYPALGIQD